MNKLSKRLKTFRADRPDEWQMDEFIKLAESLEAENAELKSGQKILVAEVDELVSVRKKPKAEKESGWLRDSNTNINKPKEQGE